MPMTMPSRTSTTRISIRVMPRELRAVPNSPCAGFVFIASSPSSPRRLGPLDAASGDKFAHAEQAEQNRQHDAEDEHGKPEDQHRLEDGEETLDCQLHLAVIDVGNAAQHLLQSTRLLA